MECYNCHRVIERHEYTRHVGSCIIGNDTRMRSWPDPAFPTFSYDTVDYDHHGTIFPAHSTPPRLRARTPQEHARQQRPATPNDQLQSSGLGDSFAQPVPADNHREARFTPSRFPVRSAAVPDRAHQQETPWGQSIQLNAFQTWFKSYAHGSPKYTTIDGQQKSDSDLQAFRQAAEVLRATTKEDVVKIVTEFKGFRCSGDQKTCLELVRKVPIFPGLVAYTYTHLVMCPQRGFLGWVYNDDWSDQVSELKKLVERWAKYDNIWCILSCEKIKKGLLKILCATKVTPEEHKCNSALLNKTMVLNHDILNLAALAALCITGSRKEDILDKPGAQVGKLIELFHDLLESNVKLGECYRRRFFKVLIAFSKEYGCCPRSIDITEGAINCLEWRGQGGFGSVYKGKLGSRSVAVKALKRDTHTSLHDYSKQLSKEAIVWRYLRHPNCLPLYGVYTMPTEGPNISLALVSPWMDQGTLFNYLELNPEANRTKLILDVVRGLTYLHTMKPHVAHRDIKPDNILITGKGHACLADFGLVSAFDTNDHLHITASKVEMGGTYDYMAPEVVDVLNLEAEARRQGNNEARRQVISEAKRKVNTRLCDMYALGCTVYAAYMGKHPPTQFRANVMSGRRLESLVDKIPHDMWSFVESLCDPKPQKRLTAEMALDWMRVKASNEGVDSSLGPPGDSEEEWEWKSQPEDESLWSVSESFDIKL